MTTVKWKQAVFDCLLNLLSQHGTDTFELEDVYESESGLARLFPMNRNVRPKIRQTLQRLRDDGLLLFHGAGHYELNLQSPEIVCELVYQNLPGGTEHPALHMAQRCLRLRNTILGMEMKRRYSNLCQVCGTTVRLGQEQNYSEAHHLRPLGSPHDGPDVPGNIIVLCPNHHVMFDRGAATVLPETCFLKHTLPDVFDARATLRIEPWHKLSRKSVRYHHEII